MKKHFLLFAITLLSVLSFSQVSDWNNGGGNPERNGFAFVNGPENDSVLWQATPTGIFGMPGYIEGNKFVTMRFHSLTNAPIVCYDLTTGQLLWEKEITGLAGRSLPIGFRDGQVYAMRLTESLNDSLYALNAEDGKIEWTSNTTIDTYISASANFDSNGDLFVESFASGQFKMNKIDHLTGELIWGTNIMPIVLGASELTIYGNTGYYIGQTGGIVKVFALDLEMGQIKYSQSLNYTHGTAVPQCPIMVGPDGTIYAPAQSDNVTALVDDGNGLTVLWETKIYGNAPFSHMCVGSDGSVYAPSDGKIIRLDPATGQIRNTSATICQNADLFMLRLSATQNGIIYATNGENGVYAFSLDLQEIWSDYVPNVNTCGAVIGSDGLIAVSGANVIKVYIPGVNTAIGETTVEEQVNVFPNPLSGILNIEVNDELKNTVFFISDQTGKQVMSGQLLNNLTTFDVSSLAPGCYLLQVGNNSKHNIKLLKH